MPDALAEARRHVEAAAALLRGLEQSSAQHTIGGNPAGPEDAFTAQARASVQIDALAMAELVAAAQALGLTPSTTLRAALRALREQVGRQQRRPAVGRLVGAQRGALEGKR